MTLVLGGYFYGGKVSFTKLHKLAQWLGQGARRLCFWSYPFLGYFLSVPLMPFSIRVLVKLITRDL